MPSAVFDILGTFFSVEPLRQRLSALGAPEHTLELWLAESLRDFFALSHAGAYTPLEQVLAAALPRTIAEVGRGSADPSRHELVLKGLKVLNPSEGAADAVHRLTASGWTVIALTNGSEEHARALLDRAGLLSKFSAVLSADEVRKSKPHHDVYALARKHADGEAWMISAHAWDAMGARRAGLRSAWISKKERQWLSAYPSPDLIAPDLATVATLLEGRGAALGPAHA